MLDQDKNFFLISASILITCLLDNVWIFWGEFVCQSLLGVERLILSLPGEIKMELPYQYIFQQKGTEKKYTKERTLFNLTKNYLS